MRAKNVITIAFFALVRGLAWLFMLAGVLSFWAGDRALCEFAHMDWLLAELLGLGIAAVCLSVGFVLKTFAKR